MRQKVVKAIAAKEVANEVAKLASQLQPTKPLDRWLGMAGIAATIIFFLIPKTPAVLLISLACIFLLVAHPIWNFWWIEQTRARRITSLAVVVLGLAALGVYAWPHELKSFVYLYPVGAAGPDHRDLLLILSHRGPQDTFNIKVLGTDMERGLKHRERASTPDEIRQETFTLTVPEIDAVASLGPPPGLVWHLISEHGYIMAEISFRSGHLLEIFQTKWVRDHWARAIKVSGDINDNKGSVLECKDLDFIGEAEMFQSVSSCTF